MLAYRFNKLVCGSIVLKQLTPIILVSVLIILPQMSIGYAQTDFTLRTSQQVYVPGETLEIRGTAEPNQVLIVRLYDPAGLAIRIDSLEVGRDGTFRKGILVWPEPTRNLVFGSYTIEVFSSTEQVEVLTAEVTFTGGPNQGIDPSLDHILGVKLDSPSQVTVNSPFRIFVQITFDGALVEAEDDNAVRAILGTSHVHSSNSTIILADKFKQLHPGIYYADVAVETEDTYVIHGAAFYRGFLSHDTRLVAATGSSIGTIQESVNKLNTGLDSTNQELERLQQGLTETQSALNDTKTTITTSVDEAQTSIRDQLELAQQASGQINALILPVLALISIIIALQISLFARIKASYK